MDKGEEDMRRGCLIAAVVLLLLPLLTQAQSLRDQFREMVEQLQRNPNDDLLRQRIIRLAQDIKPPPAIPEEARRHFFQASGIAKVAKEPNDFELAISNYREALKFAPWWGDAYFDLSVAHELAGQFDGAIATLKLYLLTNPAPEHARAAQDRIYAIEGKKRAAQLTEKRTLEAAAAQQAVKRTVAGTWYGETGREYVIRIVGDSSRGYRANLSRDRDFSEAGPFSIRLYNFSTDGQRVRWTSEHRFEKSGITFNYNYDLSISNDGSRLVGTWGIHGHSSSISPLTLTRGD